MYLFLLPLVAVVLLSMPLIPILRGKVTGKKAKNTFIFQLCSFAGVMAIAFILPIGGFVSAAEVEGAVNASQSAQGMGYLAAALATGLSSLGAGIAVASGSSAAIGAVAEDPKSFVKSVIFVALGEGVALYGVLISMLIISSL